MPPDTALTPIALSAQLIALDGAAPRTVRLLPAGRFNDPVELR